MTKKYNDVMIKHIQMDLCCEVFEKRMALSHLPIMMQITMQDHHGKKRKSSFWPIGGCGYPAIPASGNIGRSDESFSIPFP